MRLALAFLQLMLSTTLGVAVVWAFSNAQPDWMKVPLIEPARFDLSGLDFPAALGRPASAVEPASVAAPAEDAPGSLIRVAPPFAGLELSNALKAIAREAEPLRLSAERDAEGRWVVGYGRRLAEQPLRPISADLAEAMLVEDLTAAGQSVRAAVEVSLSEEEYGALVEFARTVGPEEFDETLVAVLLNAGDRQAAADAMMIWSRIRVDGALVDSPERAAHLARLRDLFLLAAAPA